jgi:hypothetical protein
VPATETEEKVKRFPITERSVLDDAAKEVPPSTDHTSTPEPIKESVESTENAEQISVEESSQI